MYNVSVHWEGLQIHHSQPKMHQMAPCKLIKSDQNMERGLGGGGGPVWGENLTESTFNFFFSFFVFLQSQKNKNIYSLLLHLE